MILLYKITFITGVLYAIVSLVLGNLFDSLDFDMDVEFDFPALTILPIKPITIVAFITVFGGVGIMASAKGVVPVYTFIISFASGYIISLLIYRFIMLPLLKAQNTSASSQKELVGVTAKVISTIVENGFGQITYVNKGNTYTSPAKHAGGKSIKTSTMVVIVSIKENVFYVEPKEEFFQDIFFEDIKK